MAAPQGGDTSVFSSRKEMIATSSRDLDQHCVLTETLQII
jgi:hypothetical protein